MTAFDVVAGPFKSLTDISEFPVAFWNINHQLEGECTNEN